MELLVVALLIIVILWLIFKPDWAPKPPDTSQWTTRAGEVTKQATAKAGEMTKQATAKAGQVTKQATAKAGEVTKQATTKAGEVTKQAGSQAGQMYSGVRERFKPRTDIRQLAKQFKQWVSDAALPKREEFYSALPASADGFAVWLGALSEQDLQAFTLKVAQFCDAMDFDLAWLNDPQVIRDPEMKKSIEDIVLLYSLSAWHANNVQQDVKAFLAYKDWDANPKQNKAFGQRLHQVLFQQGMVTIPTELYLASEQQRMDQAIAAISLAAQENPVAFHAALRQATAKPVEPVEQLAEQPAPTEQPAPIEQAASAA
jgi:hypothetical protein